MKNRLLPLLNIYFDTPSHLLIRRSLDKPVYKEKLRLRSYKRPGDRDTVFIELKKKYNGVVYKRRISMPYKEAVAYLYRHEEADAPSQITKEVDWTLQFYGELIPQMFLSYDRLAYYSKDDPNLRVTFDTNITYREEHLSLEDTAACTTLLPQGQYLMELKVADAMPLWLTHALNELEIYPVSFSKYGAAYMQTLKSA